MHKLKHFQVNVKVCNVESGTQRGGNKRGLEEFMKYSEVKKSRGCNKWGINEPHTCVNNYQLSLK